MLALVENLRRKQIAWLDAVLMHRNWNMSQLAEAGSIAPSTLSKFRNDPDNIKQLSTRVVAKIEAVGGIPPYFTAPPVQPRGIATVEVEPYQAAADAIPLLRETAKSMRNGLEMMVLRSRALEVAGYLPGDILVIDYNAEPHTGDVVAAQMVDDGKTIVRILEEPYLVTATLEPTLMRPLHVGRDAVVLRGVVTSSIRSRRAA